jgi:hypothetical protein
MLSVANKPVMLSVFMLNVVMLSVVMLSVVVLSVVMLSVVVLNVVAPSDVDWTNRLILRKKNVKSNKNERDVSIY